jgi:hypothetical protein
MTKLQDKEMIKVIGLSGVAQSGKDTFCASAIRLLNKQGVKAQRVSFADALKADADPFLLDRVGISAFTTKIEEKTLIRDFLVAYGTKLMRKIDQSCWINKVSPLVEENINNDIITIITDIRYQNEMSWVQDDLGGKCMHLTRVLPDNKGEALPANSEELLNDPILESMANIQLTWASIEDEEVLDWVVGDELNKLFNLS